MIVLNKKGGVLSRVPLLSAILLDVLVQHVRLFVHERPSYRSVGTLDDSAFQCSFTGNCIKELAGLWVYASTGFNRERDELVSGVQVIFVLLELSDVGVMSSSTRADVRAVVANLALRRDSCYYSVEHILRAVVCKLDVTGTLRVGSGGVFGVPDFHDSSPGTLCSCLARTFAMSS